MKRLLAVLCLTSSCVSPMMQVKKELGPKAAENMGCAEDQLTYEDQQQVVVMVTRVKVKGCGKETTWYFEESRWKKQ